MWATFEFHAVPWVGWTFHRSPNAQPKYLPRPQTLEGSDAPLHSNARARLPEAPRARAVSVVSEMFSSVTNAATDSSPLAPPTADGHGGGGDHDEEDDNDDNGTLSPLVDLAERFPNLFAQKVLQHMYPIDRTFLAQAASTFRAAVSASDLPRAGTSRVQLGRIVWVVRHRLQEFVGSVGRLAWAKTSGCPWVAKTCAIAAGGGRLDVLKWARDHNCPWNTGTTASAALGGHLEVLQWAREQGCPWWEEGICLNAAWGGHLEVLQWAREQGCPWHVDTCSHAASGGHLDVLRWARAHGCPWSMGRCDDYSRSHPETHAWVRAQM